MQEGNPIEEDRSKVAQIKELVQGGAYVVDPEAVAGAILRHLAELTEARGERVDPGDDGDSGGATHTRCSYPDRGPSASTKIAPAGPSVTRPIHVRPRFGARLASSFSTLWRDRGAMQTHSS